MAKIFISYRREDSAPYAGRLHDRLVQEFGRANIFMDIDTIDPGVDFLQAIESAVSSVDFMLCVIGPDWLATDADGRLRLSDPRDFVALEVASALAREIRVVPVLVGGAELPADEVLPENLRGLTRRNATRLDDADFQRDANRLVDSIRRTLGADTRKRPWKPILAVVAAVVALAIGGSLIWLRGGGTGERPPTPPVKQGIDLELVRSTIVPKNPAVGDKVTAHVLVRNNGETASPRFTLKWWPSSSQPDTVETVLRLKPGADTAEQLVYGGFAKAGTYKSRIIIDRERAIPESNRNNNTDEFSITVTEKKTDTLSLVLVDAGPNKITAIKLVRAYTGLGLAEAKDLVENAPRVILEGISRDDARKALAEFEKNGVRVEVRRE